MRSPENTMDLLVERQRRITVDEYHRMIEAGILDEDDNVELIRGVLVAHSPQKGPHARIIQRLTGLLVRALGEAWDVRVQLPLTLTDSEPEPDFAIVPHGDEGEGDEHPKSAILVIEVARSSARFDRLVKAPLYAQAGVPEYWVIDLNARQIHVMRDPDSSLGQYRAVSQASPEDLLSPAAFPEARIKVRDLLA